MNDIIMRPGDPRTLITHAALYGLATILHDTAIPNLHLSWTPGPKPRPRITAPDLTAIQVGQIVHDHATAHTAPTSWMQRDVVLGKPRAAMSPRLSAFGDKSVWEHVQHTRHHELDHLTTHHAWSDLRFLAALGEPSYWSRDHTRKPGKPDLDLKQDDGASRLEMQPRNSGANIIQSRLRKLAAKVAAREPAAVLAGLDGTTIIDDLEPTNTTNTTSFTASGLTNLEPVDSATAWCAFWGLSAFPTTPRIDNPAHTAGHLRHHTNEWFYAPVWTTPWHPARLRHILASQQLRNTATTGLTTPHTTTTRETTGRDWLTTRGTIAIIRFPIHHFTNDKTTDRRAMRGTITPLTTP